MTAGAELGAVVVSFHSAATIERCLADLLASPLLARVLVVDNASADDTVARVAAMALHEPRISLVRQAQNHGYGHACNVGASALATDWVLFLNPDAYIAADALARLMAHARQRPGAGLIGANLLDAQGIADPGARRADPTLAELLQARGRRGHFLLGRDPEQDLQAVAACSGALMLLPLGLFLKLGGFDTGYRLHAEDLDLCRRVREAGYEVCVANDVDVVHLGGVSSRVRPLWVEWHKHRGLWRYFRKFEGRRAGAGARGLVFMAIWARFLLAAPRAWWRARLSAGG